MRSALLLIGLFSIVGCQPESSETAEGRAQVETVQPSALPEPNDLELRAADAQEILTYVRDSPARVKVVNFWATWCVPCREEFPDLVRVGNDYRDQGLEMIFVSADFPDQEADAIAFLREQGVEGITFLKNESNDDAFISAFDAEWMGELPATIVYGADDQKTHIWHGPTTYDAVSAQVAPMLNNP